MVPKSEFKISNAVLTAEEYSDSPLYNKLEGEQEFPLIGNTNFYAISLQKTAEPLQAQKPEGVPVMKLEEPEPER